MTVICTSGGERVAVDFLASRLRGEARSLREDSLPIVGMDNTGNLPKVVLSSHPQSLRNHPAVARPLMTPSFVRVLLAFDVLLGALYLATRFWPVPSYFVMMNLDLDSEGTFTSWYASAKWLIAANMAWIGTTSLRTSSNARARVAGYLLPATLLFLSIDESVGVHEQLGSMMDRFVVDRRQTLFSETNYWMVPCGAVLLAIAASTFRDIQRLSSRSAALMLAGLCLLVLGGGIVEGLQNFLVADSPEIWVQIVVEETLENVGGTTTVWAMLSLMSVNPAQERSPASTELPVENQQGVR